MNSAKEIRVKKTVILASIAFISLLGCTDDRKAENKTGQTSTTTHTTTTTTEKSGNNPPGIAETSPTGSSAMSETDRALAQRVEDALKKNAALAPAAQNVQVQAMNGEVVLRGSVNNEQEKANIAAEAQKVAGVSKVTNQIEVASASSR
jgi:osmotically-inducible protein OsmY